MEIGKVCRDTTTIPHNSSTKRGYMRGGGSIYIYIYIEDRDIDNTLTYTPAKLVRARCYGKLDSGDIGSCFMRMKPDAPAWAIGFRCVGITYSHASTVT